MAWFKKGDSLTAKSLNALGAKLEAGRVIRPHSSRQVTHTTGMPQFGTALTDAGVWIAPGRAIYVKKTFNATGRYVQNNYYVKTYDETFVSASDPFSGDFYVYIKLSHEDVDSDYLRRVASGDITDGESDYEWVDRCYTPETLAAAAEHPESDAAIIAHYYKGCLKYHVRGAVWLFPHGVSREVEDEE